jgi:predicted transcriptional regulator
MVKSLTDNCPKKLEFGGLKIKKKFIDYILDGKKTWEIRNRFGDRARKYLNIPILLLPICDKKTTDCNTTIVLGVVKIVGYLRVTLEEALELVKTEEEREFIMNRYGKKKYLYALRLENPVRFQKPLKLPDPIKYARTYVCNFSPQNKEVIKRKLHEIRYL